MIMVPRVLARMTAMVLRTMTTLMIRTSAIRSMRRNLLILANLTTILTVRTTIPVALVALALIGALLTYTVPSRSLMVPERKMHTALLTIPLTMITMA
jgi:hypothetical protein